MLTFSYLKSKSGFAIPVFNTFFVKLYTFDLDCIYGFNIKTCVLHFFKKLIRLFGFGFYLRIISVFGFVTL